MERKRFDEWFKHMFYCPHCSKLLFMEVHVIEDIKYTPRAILKLSQIEDMQRRDRKERLYADESIYAEETESDEDG